MRISGSWELRAQKLRFPLCLEPGAQRFFPLKPSSFLNVTFLVHSPSFFQKLSLDFLALVVANAGPCVDVLNEVGHPALRHR